MNSIGTKSVREPERDFKSRHQAVLDILDGDHHYLERWLRLRRLMRKIRTSEYQITNACNLRCKGCWFFEYDFDKRTKDVKDIDALKTFLENERARGVNAALVIGGEPTLFPRRIAAFVEHIDYVTLATNGLRKFPTQCFEQVTLLVALFGGSRLDDELRAIKPGGKRFKGLFDQALKNYYQDPRAFFLFAITEDGIDQIEEAVKRIGDNGSRLHFSFYSKYDSDDPLRVEDGQRLIDTALRAKQRYPDTVASHPYYIETMITGRSHWAEFGYGVCPSFSVDHPAHAERIANGNPFLPGFNTWAADLETITFCCTSGHCDGCRDSQAVFSWLLTNMQRFRANEQLFKTWIEIAESFWSQFIWVSSAAADAADDVGKRAVS
jgi:organic radical activating enzyme